MRRPILATSFLFALLVTALLPAPRAGAQEQPAATLRLLHQSPWNGPDRPLEVTLEATSQSDVAFENLSIVLSIFPPPSGRIAYEQSLQQDGALLFAYPFPQRGVLRPGQTRTFEIVQPLDVLTARAATAVYPLSVELRSNDAPVATLRTAMVFLIESPPTDLRLGLAWTFALTTRLQLLPGGSVGPGPLEGDIAAGGRLDVIASVLGRLSERGVPLDAAISPTLAEELVRMSDGYRSTGIDGQSTDVPKGEGAALDAERLLEALRRIARAPSTEVVPSTGWDATLPSLISSGLSASVDPLIDQGTRALTQALGRAPSSDTFRPAGSQLDASSLVALAGRGYRTVLVDRNYLRPEDTIATTPPPTVRLMAGLESLIGVTPDPGVGDLLSAYSDDPHLAAHAALGELATIWLESPGTAGRGAALLFSDRTTLGDPALLRSITSLVARSPWLRPMHASNLAAFSTAPPQVEVPSHNYARFSLSYAQAFRAAQVKLQQFDKTVRDDGDVTGALQSDLQLSLSGAFVKREAQGRAYIDAVNRTIDAIYRRVRVDNIPLTMASRSVLMPVTVRNDSGKPMSVRIRLIADRRISFVRGNARVVNLSPGTQTFTFPVRAETTGRFPVKIQIRTAVPDSMAQTIAETQVVVRSTAYNRVALFMTVGAGVFLLGWWGLRLLRLLPQKKK